MGAHNARRNVLQLRAANSQFSRDDYYKRVTMHEMPMSPISSLRSWVHVTAACFVIAIASQTQADPFFPIPGVNHPPRFTAVFNSGVVNLPGSTPGSNTLISTVFNDSVVAPSQPFHWQTELRNASASPFNLGLVVDYSGVGHAEDILLNPGESVLLNTDIPEPAAYEGAAWAFRYHTFNLPATISVHTTVFEYPTGSDPGDQSLAFTFSGSGHTISTFTGSVEVVLEPVVPEPSVSGICLTASFAVITGRRRRSYGR